MAAGVGPMTLMMLLMLGGGLGLPLGVPPLPPDATILQSAPEKCLLFISSAGMAQLDPKSTNHTEQLLAEEDVREFWAQLELQILGAVRQAAQNNPEALPWVDVVPPLVKTFLARPWAAYIDRFVPPEGAGPPDISAAFIINCGERAGDTKDLVKQIEKLATRDSEAADQIEEVQVNGTTLWHWQPKDGPPLHWGFKDKLFIFTVGTDTAAELLTRIEGSKRPPAWLVSLQKQAGIERISTITYFNVATVLDQVRAANPDPKLPDVLELFGVDNLQVVGSVTGLDQQGMVSRMMANVQGNLHGLFDLVAAKPLAADDLKPVPENATLAAAARLDLATLYRQWMQGGQKIDPGPYEQFHQQVVELEQHLGFQIEQDLLASLGDVWTIHGSAMVIPNPFANVVLTASLRDKAKLAEVQEKLLTFINAELERNPDPPFAIRESTVRGIKVHHLQPTKPIPFSPAWALTDDHLIITVTLPALKAQLSQGDKTPKLAALPAVADRLKDRPAVLFYQDAKTFVRQIHAAVQAFGPMAIGALAQQGIEFDLPALPGMEVIEPHVLPMVAIARRTKNGVVVDRYSSVPMIGAELSPAPAGIMVALMLPAVQAAREAARRSQSSNNLKQLALAMLNHEATYRAFPAAAIYDKKQEKPLLSWRVRILPFLDEKELYDQFHLDEPWDSEHNKKLIEKMPAVFASPNLGDLGGKTVYLVPTGENTLFSGEKGPRMKDILDGTSKTIMIVEASRDQAVEWTKPDDLEIDPKDPWKGLRNVRPGGFQTAFADGAVHFIANTLDAEVLKLLFDPNDGQAVDLPDR